MFCNDEHILFFNINVFEPQNILMFKRPQDFGLPNYLFNLFFLLLIIYLKYFGSIHFIRFFTYCLSHRWICAAAQFLSNQIVLLNIPFVERKCIRFRTAHSSTLRYHAVFNHQWGWLFRTVLHDSIIILIYYNYWKCYRHFI